MKPFDVQNLGIWSLHHVAPLFSPMCFTLNHLSWDVLFQCCKVNQCNPSRLHVDDVAPPSLSVHNTPCQLTIEDCSRSYKVLTTCFYLWGFLTKPLQNSGIMSTRRWDLGPLHTRDWEPVTITIQALSSVEKAEPVKFSSHYAWGTNGVCECKMDVKSTWHRMDHVSWSLGLFSKTTFWR
jgi:hypothetical protein